MPVASASVVVWALPAGEFAVAVAMLPSGSAVLASIVALVLLAVFTAAVAVQLRRGGHPSCSCFGAASTGPISGWTLARDAGIAVLVSGALWGSSTHGGVPGDLPPDRAVGLAAIVMFAAVQTWQAAKLRALRRELAELRHGPSGAEAEGLAVGSVAPGFDLPGIDGGRGTLGALVDAGNPVALVFVDPGCGPCQIVAGELADWRTRRRATLTVIAIGGGDLAANAEWARTHDVHDMLVQDRNEVAVAYRLRGTPTAVLVDTKGRIAAPPARGPGELRKPLSNRSRTMVSP